MSISKKFCSPEDVEKRYSTTNKKDEMQEYEKRILQCVLAEKINSRDLKNWLVFNLLEPEFISQIYMVLVYRDHEAITVMKDQNVYSLAYLKTRTTQTAIHPKKIKELCGKNIKTFAYGIYFMLALTEEGKVYSCILAKQPGEMNDWTYWADWTKMIIPEESTFTQVTSLSEKRIVNIACGKGHCLALTSDGKVYAWGFNGFGQVGHKNTDIFINVPWEVRYELENKNVIHIACGLNFNIVITDENKIYGWGDNSMKQISTIELQKCHVPHEIATISDKIVKVTCGIWHTLALTDKGDIYAWGDNRYGKIGTNNERKSSPPIKVNVPKMGKVLDIAAFSHLSIAIGYDEIIYIWGYFCHFFDFNIPFPTKFLTIYDVLFARYDSNMHKPLTVFTNIEEELNILESIGARFDDSLTGDFTIQVEGRPIYVHKAILQIRCEYFRNMFRHDWAGNSQSIFDAPSVFTVSNKFSYIVYKAFLKYLYIGTIDLPSENALELMELADIYCETNLLKECSKIIKKSITVSNVAFFYNKAIQYNAKELVEFCFHFADTFTNIKLDMNMQTKFMSRETNKKHKMQKYENKILLCILAKKIISKYFRNWPFFQLLKPEFIIQIHMIITFHIHLKPGVIIVTKDNNVYSSIYYSRIRNGVTDMTALSPKKIKQLCGKNIKTFAGGFRFILALTEEGEVYSCDLTDKFEKITFIQVTSLNEKRIVNIACNEYQCLARTSDGKVYAWKHDYGQVGNENTDSFISVPWEVKYELENKNVIHIACGSNFNIVITDENKIYGWGDNSKKQISTIESQTCHVPHEIATITDKIVKVTCGGWHTLALTDKGDIYAWGDNEYGKIGINNERKNSPPKKVNVPKMGKVLDIAAFSDFSIAIGYDKIIYIWGRLCYLFDSNIPFPTKFLTIYDVYAHSYWPMDMPLTVFTNIEEELNILESIEAAFDDSLTGDFTIQVEGRLIYVHKAILKIRCEYFRNMFRHDWAENSQSKSGSSSVLTVGQFSYMVYKAFLKYLYTGQIDLPSENALELLELADMYCETNLLKDCSKIIEKSITVSNVAFFYDKAIEYNAKELEEFCVHFSLRHMADVVLSEDYIKLDVNTKNNFMRRVAKENAFRV